MSIKRIEKNGPIAMSSYNNPEFTAGDYSVTLSSSRNKWIIDVMSSILVMPEPCKAKKDNGKS